MAQQLEEAPYSYIWEKTVVDGKEVKVFTLGRDGKAKLEASVSHNDFQCLERDFWKLRNFINYLSINDQAIIEKLANCLLDNFPKHKSVRYGNIPDFHPALQFNHTLAYQALDRLVEKHVLVEKRGWIKRVATEA